MANEELITRYSADSSNYVAGTRRAIGSTKQLTTAIDHAQRSLGSGGAGGGSSKGLSSIIQGVGSSVSGLGGELGGMAAIAGEALPAVGIAIGAVTVALAGMISVGIQGAQTFAGLAKTALDAYSEIDSLKRGLVAVTGSSEEAELQFQRLLKISKLPGIDIGNAVEGTLKLQSAGLSANLAERAIEGFGNALATVGKGAAELDGVTTALTQIQSKGVVSAEEINQLAERLPGIRVMMQSAFGTSNTEQIQKMGLSTEYFITKLVEEAEKADKVTGGVKNTMENLAQSIKLAWASAGKVIANFFLPAIERVANMIDGMTKDGAFARIANLWSRVFGGGQKDLFVTIGSYLFALMEELPKGIIGAVEVAQMGIKWIVAAFQTVVEMASRLVPFIGNKIKEFSSSVATIMNSNPVTAGMYSFFDDIQKNAEKYQKMAEGMDTSQDPGPLPSLMGQQNSTLSKIDQNTKRTADIMSRQEQLSQAILGGGSMGQMGITPVELGGIKKGKSKLHQAISNLAGVFYEEGQKQVMNNLIAQRRGAR